MPAPPSMRVVAGAALQVVAALAAGDPVVTGQAVDGVVAVAAGQDVVAAVAVEIVAVGAAADAVVAGAGLDPVPAVEAEDDVPAVTGVDPVVALAAEQGQVDPGAGGHVDLVVALAGAHDDVRVGGVAHRGPVDRDELLAGLRVDRDADLVVAGAGVDDHVVSDADDRRPVACLRRKCPAVAVPLDHRRPRAGRGLESGAGLLQLTDAAQQLAVVVRAGVVGLGDRRPDGLLLLLRGRIERHRAAHGRPHLAGDLAQDLVEHVLRGGEPAGHVVHRLRHGLSGLGGLLHVRAELAPVGVVRVGRRALPRVAVQPSGLLVDGLAGGARLGRVAPPGVGGGGDLRRVGLDVPQVADADRRARRLAVRLGGSCHG